MKTSKKQSFPAKVMAKKRRQPGIELLRIIAIFLIIGGHFNDHQPDTLKYTLPEMGQMGVIIFFMISGWCNVKSLKHRFPKFFVQLAINVFGGVIFSIALFYTHLSPFNPFQVLFGCSIQSTYSSGWFLGIYFVVSLLQVPLNYFIQKTNKWLSFGIIFISLLCGIFLRSRGITGDYINPERILYGLVFYCFAAGVSFHWKEKINTNNTGHKGLILSCLFAGSIVLYYFFSTIYGYFCTIGFYQLSIDYLWTFMLLIPALIWLIFFDNIPGKMKEKTPIGEKVVIFLAGETLSVYLYHSMVWVVLDGIFGTYNCLVILNNYGIKFIVYLSIALVLCTLMHLFVKAQETFFGKLGDNHKKKKELNKIKK